MGQLTDRRTWLNMQVWPAQLYAAGVHATAWWKVRPDADCVLATPLCCPARIELDHQPSQWRLSPALAGALSLKGHHSVPYVMQMLWGYIKAKQLYEVRRLDGGA